MTKCNSNLCQLSAFAKGLCEYHLNHQELVMVGHRSDVSLTSDSDTQAQSGTSNDTPLSHLADMASAINKADNVDLLEQILEQILLQYKAELRYGSNIERGTPEEEAKQAINQLIDGLQVKTLERLLEQKSVLTLRDHGGNRREEVTIVPVSAVEALIKELRGGSDA
ncbi:MAG: hypothetical protein JWL86_6968 [Rhizobium sp.]|nr:hypothetical protein [Rhizobium sp.]